MTPSTLLSAAAVSVGPVAVAALGLWLLFRLVLWPLFFSPLARLPSAHWSAALSPLWILWVRRTQRENATLLAAHQRLGPIVRVGPSDVSISDPESVRVVYGGGFDKTDWYAVFDNYGVPCMFGTRPGREHSLRKRMITHVYSKSFIHTSPAVAAQTHGILSERLLPLLAASSAPVDVFPLFLATSMDFISAFVFGGGNGTDFLHQHAYRVHWLELYLSRHGAPFFPQELPRLTRVLRRFGLSPYPRWVDRANAELAAWNQELCHGASALLDGENQDKEKQEEKPVKERSDRDEPVVMRALVAGLQREEAMRGTASPLYATALSQRALSIQSELFDHVLAGHETTGIALTYAAWHLSRCPDAQAAVRAEVAAAGGADTLDARARDRLPLLHAVVMETLRLHAPIPGPQPRQTPAAGCRIGPYTLPGGVRIAAPAFTLHRDARVFPDPDTWDYRRWLDDGTDEDDAARRARARQFWAFSSGGRMCIGSNFALHEMKAVLAAIYSRFATTVVDDAGIEQGDGYTTRPQSEQLWLRFEQLPDQ